MTRVNSIERILVFVGNFSPLYLIVYIIYDGFSVSPYLIPLAFTFLANLTWKHILSNNHLKECESQNFTLAKLDDIGPQIIGYFLSYSVSLPSVILIGGSEGMVVLFILMVLIGILFHGNKIMLYNPFLSVFGYRVYKVWPSKGPTVFVISKDRVLEEEEDIKTAKLEDYVYVLKNGFKPVKREPDKNLDIA